MISAAHCVSASFEETDWAHIRSLYDLLLSLNPSPVTALAKAVATLHSLGPSVALDETSALAQNPQSWKILSSYSSFWAAQMEIFVKLGRSKEAHHAFEKALTTSDSQSSRISLKWRFECLVLKETEVP